MSQSVKSLAIEKAIKDAGAFWAFGEKQFNEQKVTGIIYAQLGAGLMCPKENVDSLIKALKTK